MRTRLPFVDGDEISYSRNQESFIRQREEISRNKSLLRMMNMLNEMKIIFSGLVSPFPDKKLEGTLMSLDDIHRCATDLYQLAMEEGHSLAMFVARSLQTVIEGVVDPSRASFYALKGHLEILDRILESDIRSKEDLRSVPLLEFMDALRALSIEESRQARSLLRANRVKCFS